MPEIDDVGAATEIQRDDADLFAVSSRENEYLIAEKELAIFADRQRRGTLSQSNERPIQIQQRMLIVALYGDVAKVCPRRNGQPWEHTRKPRVRLRRPLHRRAARVAP